jgi:hypothetical protein
MAKIELSNPRCDRSNAFCSLSVRRDKTDVFDDAPLLGLTRCGKCWGYRLTTSPIAAVETSMLFAMDAMVSFLA